MNEKNKRCVDCQWFGGGAPTRWTGMYWDSSWECLKAWEPIGNVKHTTYRLASACSDFEQRKPKPNDCPVCGGKTEPIRNLSLKYWVKCSNREDCYQTGPVRDTEIEAIEAFNKLKYEG